MSEELTSKGLSEHGLRVSNYEYYNIGSTTLNQLKKHAIIQDRDYKEYGNRKPDGLLVDRRRKDSIHVVCVLEYKESGKFKSKKDKVGTVQQCNDLAQILKADIGIASDGSSFIWINPNHPDPSNTYLDDTTATSRSYSTIRDDQDNPFVKEFVIDQKMDEQDLTRLNVKTRSTIENVHLLVRSMSPTNSKLIKESTVDPTALAKQIWQDVWSVSGATPENCLYTFVEVFIFKYLSDLGILDDDDKGNMVNFKDIIKLDQKKAFINYHTNVRPYLKKMFPADPEDKTTIINGTVLNPGVPEHSLAFHKILQRFEQFGPLKNIDPSFKSKVFEEFMKEQISRKNWGQFFTPRRIIDAMIEISDIDKLDRDAEICDPSCGVGGFILEPLRVKDNGVNYYYRLTGDHITPRLKFYGYDKGFEKEEQLTIILAKANMLIFLSELLQKNSTLAPEFASLFNSTFKLLHNTVLGTLARTEKDRYDLILTNPPYVTSGSAHYKNAIKNSSNLSNYYKINAMGVEGLFLEWIIRSLKPAKKAFVIIPDGILSRINDNKLRQFVKEQCIIDGIISIPVDAFYRNPKKTYILAITKKPEQSDVERSEHRQKEPVFTYLVSDIGETLDVDRFPIEQNDLKEMVSLFNQFKGAKTSFKTDSKRCKIQPIEKFEPDDMWLVDRWWTKEEKIHLGIEVERVLITFSEFKDKVKEIEQEIHQLNDQLEVVA